MITRVYPIRLNKKEWDIPIHSYHKCSESCAIKHTISNGMFQIIPNPSYKNGKCDQDGKLQRSTIKLEDYDINTLTCAQGGKLYNPNEIIVPDKEFTLIINFPLRSIVTAHLTSVENEEFTRINVLKCISSLYKHIYETEEKTSSVKNFNIKITCENGCLTEDVYNHIDEHQVNKENEECSICKVEFQKDENIGKLKCNHLFHKECILHWANNSQTCPICRKNIIKCEICNGSGWTEFSYRGKIIPREYRLGGIRNTTDGVFGIYRYDLKDIGIHSMHYDKTHKQLNLIIKTYIE